MAQVSIDYGSVSGGIASPEQFEFHALQWGTGQQVPTYAGVIDGVWQYKNMTNTYNTDYVEANFYYDGVSNWYNMKYTFSQDCTIYICIKEYGSAQDTNGFEEREIKSGDIINIKTAAGTSTPVALYIKLD